MGPVRGVVRCVGAEVRIFPFGGRWQCVRTVGWRGGRFSLMARDARVFCEWITGRSDPASCTLEAQARYPRLLPRIRAKRLLLRVGARVREHGRREGHGHARSPAACVHAALASGLLWDHEPASLFSCAIASFDVWYGVRV